MDWIRERLTKLFDGLLLAGVLAGVAVIGSIIAFGGEKVSLPIWLLVLFAAILAASLMAVLVLAIRMRRLAVPESAVEHPHRRLLKRLKALNDSLGDHDPNAWVRTDTARVYNDLHHEAWGVDDEAVNGVPPVRIARSSDEYTDVRVEQLRLRLDQLTAIVE